MRKCRKKNPQNYGYFGWIWWKCLAKHKFPVENVANSTSFYTTAVDCSFSTLKHLKMLLRYKTGNGSLTEHVLLSVYGEVFISIKKVLDTMAKKQKINIIL